MYEPVERRNTSGMGEKSIVPPSVKNKFNWGACMATWMWGIGNKTYITLIILVAGFIPFLSIFLSLWFGFKGNEWAWKNKRFASEADFHEYQRLWVVISIIISLCSSIILIFILNQFIKDIMSIKIF